MAAEDQVTQSPESTPVQKAAPAKKKSDDALSGKKVRLIIHKDQNKHGLKAVPIGLNGTQYLIKRGEEVIVPAEVAQVLADAIETKLEQNEKDEFEVREVPSYPFSVMPV